MECLRNNFHEGVLLDGRYETVSPLNHGSFGLVFLAKDIQTGESVAIKCLTKLSVSSTCLPTLYDERSEELVVHDRLGSHPNIVNLLGSFETDAHVFLVLEFCANGDLYEAIRLGRGPLETEHVRAFMLELVDAIGYMHSKGLYHRDIKPENIFLTQSGTLKLGDFGLATSETWTREANVGSDRYMAPEQYDPAGDGYSPEKADIWSIGVCLLNILFSRNPFATPNEADPLFSDYVRDKQSLFDVFPTMSQDTFEVLSHSMCIDPDKRSLDALRDALKRVVSFTTDDELFDEFCTENRDIVPATANREPLRTPSIQSPQVDQGTSFPWAKALHSSPPQPVRQLSVIPDTESYTEDLFPASEKTSTDWVSLAPDALSLASVVDSGIGSSLKSLTLRKLENERADGATPVPTYGSLPISGSKAIPAMSLVFGKGKKADTVSKSWSDLWDEEEEETENERETLRKHNSRSWSQESKEEKAPPVRGGLSELKSSSVVNTRTRSPEAHGSGACGVGVDGISENDGFFFEDQPQPRLSPRSMPVTKQTHIDKWAALGDRRRAFDNNKQQSMSPSRRSAAYVNNWRKEVSSGSSGSWGGVWHRKQRDLEHDWRREPQPQSLLDDTGDFEWVGGWQDLHL